MLLKIDVDISLLALDNILEFSMKVVLNNSKLNIHQKLTSKSLNKRLN